MSVYPLSRAEAFCGLKMSLYTHEADVKILLDGIDQMRSVLASEDPIALPSIAVIGKMFVIMPIINRKRESHFVKPLILRNFSCRRPKFRKEQRLGGSQRCVS